MSRQQLTIRVSVYEKKKLEEAAARTRQSVSDLLRQALNEVIADCDDGPAILKLRNK